MNKWNQTDYPKGAASSKDRHAEAQRQTIESSRTVGKRPPTFPGGVSNPEHGNEKVLTEHSPSSRKTEKGTTGTYAKSIAQPHAAFNNKGKKFR